MNIGIINTLAKSGSTGKIAYGFQQFLKAKAHNAYVFYGRKDAQVSATETDIIRIGTDFDLYYHVLCSRLGGLQGVYSKKATKKMLEQFEELEIEAVCLFNLHGYYLNFPMLFAWLGKNHISCEYVMLDEYPFLGKCTFSFDCEQFKTGCGNCPRVRDYPKSFVIDRSAKMFCLKRDAYRLAPQCIFVGIQYTVDRAKCSPAMAGFRFSIADEAIDLRNMYYPRDASWLRAKLGIPLENKIILTVAPYPDERKGGKYFLAAARALAGKKDITFVHVGFMADEAICPSNYIPVGYITDQTLLATYYSLGDLFVHTSMAETIPAAILEALACGTPVLGFDISGIPHSADSTHGTFVEPGNVDEMIKVIVGTQKKGKEMIASCQKYAKSRYDAEDYYQKLLANLEKGEGVE